MVILRSFLQPYTHLASFFARCSNFGSTGPRGHQISALLHHWDRLHGYATETKCHGRYRPRRKIFAPPFYPCSIRISFTQHSIPPPPPLPKFYSPDDHVMLEDESGRIRLVGDHIRKARLVTGIIIGALGAETANGDFEVVDICYPGMAPQPSSESEVAEQQDKMEVDSKCRGTSSDHRALIKSLDLSPASPSTNEWIAVVSGLDIGSPSPSDAQIQMLAEYLTGEGGGAKEQVSAARISRLIIAGNSLSDMPSTGQGEPGDAEQTGKTVRCFVCTLTSLILMDSDDTEMKGQHFHLTLSSIYQPTYSTLRALCLFTFFPEKQIHLGL